MNIEYPASKSMNWRAVFLGACVSIALSAFFGTLQFHVFRWLGMKIPTTLSGDPAEYVWFLVPIIYNMCGGYISASFSPSRKILHGLASGLGPFAFMVVMLLAPGSVQMMGFLGVVLAFSCPILGAPLGAWLYVRRTKA
jgi:hypothetical protein